MVENRNAGPFFIAPEDAIGAIVKGNKEEAPFFRVEEDGKLVPLEGVTGKARLPKDLNKVGYTVPSNYRFD